MRSRYIGRSYMHIPQSDISIQSMNAHVSNCTMLDQDPWAVQTIADTHNRFQAPLQNSVQERPRALAPTMSNHNTAHLIRPELLSAIPPRMPIHATPASDHHSLTTASTPLAATQPKQPPEAQQQHRHALGALPSMHPNTGASTFPLPLPRKGKSSKTAELAIFSLEAYMQLHTALTRGSSVVQQITPADAAKHRLQDLKQVVIIKYLSILCVVDCIAITYQ